MIRGRNFVWQRAAFQPALSLAVMLLLVAVSGNGCKRTSHKHTSDLRLQKIDEMINAELPPGTPRTRVEYFFNSRGYRLEDSPEKNSVVAIVRRIDTDTLQPATARATLHFDSNNKLISYELQSAPDVPPRP
jgi:hypothetical protein